MLPDIVAAGVQHRQRQGHQDQDRQQVDRAPRAPEPDLVDEQRTDGDGLARGALHEILGAGGDEEDGALAAAFGAGILGRLVAGMVLWCLPRPDLYGSGLAAHGLDPRRLVLVQAPRDAEILWAMEEGLRAPGIAAVVGEIGALAAVASRRLQLAAERSGVTALLLRRWRDGGQAARERPPP